MSQCDGKCGSLRRRRPGFGKHPTLCGIFTGKQPAVRPSTSPYQLGPNHVGRRPGASAGSDQGEARQSGRGVRWPTRGGRGRRGTEAETEPPSEEPARPSLEERRKLLASDKRFRCSWDPELVGRVLKSGLQVALHRCTDANVLPV